MGVMKVGGWVWFIAGIIFWEFLRTGLLLSILGGLIGAVERVAVFLGAVGTAGLVVITALVFWFVTRMVSENRRARFDMDRIWNSRKQYRK